MNGDMKSYTLVWCSSFSHLVLGSISGVLKEYGQDHGEGTTMVSSLSFYIFYFLILNLGEKNCRAKTHITVFYCMTVKFVR